MHWPDLDVSQPFPANPPIIGGRPGGHRSRGHPAGEETGVTPTTWRVTHSSDDRNVRLERCSRPRTPAGTATGTPGKTLRRPRDRFPELGAAPWRTTALTGTNCGS